jgi:acetyl-CoA carboxylase carboxyltransferase component
VRDVFRSIPNSHNESRQTAEPEEPQHDAKEIYGIVPRDPRKMYDVREIIYRIVDASWFHEFKALYGATVVAASRGSGDTRLGSSATTAFFFRERPQSDTLHRAVRSADIPLVFLQNITGFMVGKKFEQGGIAKDGAKMVNAVANAAVPKFTLIIGGSYGAGNYGMCGRAYGPRQLWMWPNARISVMGGEQAANVLLQVKMDQLKTQGKSMTAAEQEEFMKPTLDKYDLEGNAYYSTARLWDDGVIDPQISHGLRWVSQQQ